MPQPLVTLRRLLHKARATAVRLRLPVTVATLIGTVLVAASRRGLSPAA